MQKSALYLLCFLLAAAFAAFTARNGPLLQYPKGYFSPPLAIPLLLSGNFGELRNNHFHAGIDIRTNGVEGQAILAVADGYVSRIAVSPRGYGKALYIDHPNGYTSVYAHLSGFRGRIAEWLLEKQHRLESFEADLYPDSGLLKVLKGDTVALSGNSGSSAGAHLHFEIRETRTEHPVNPLLFGFEVEDNIPPVVSSFTVYPAGKSSLVENRHAPRRFGVYGSKGRYSGPTVNVYGSAGFGIETKDYMNKTSNTHGVYSIELTVDGRRVFRHVLDRFGFHEARFINSHIDYAGKVKDGRLTQRCFLDPNNRLNTYRDVVNRGIAAFSGDTTHLVKFIVADLHGNTSTLTVNVKSHSESNVPEPDVIGAGVSAVFPYQRPNVYKTEDVEVHLPMNTLYDTLNFRHWVSSPVPGAWSVTHHVHSSDVPVHGYYTLSIRPIEVPDSLQPKAIIVSVGANGARWAEGGAWRDGFVTARVRAFGSYAVMVDRSPPVINAINLFNGKNLKHARSIRLKAWDDLSGIGSYRATIDGRWVLTEYDAKNNLFEHTLSPALAPGKHVFSMTVTDKTGNRKVFTAEFER